MLQIPTRRHTSINSSRQGTNNITQPPTTKHRSTWQASHDTETATISSSTMSAIRSRYTYTHARVHACIHASALTIAKHRRQFALNRSVYTGPRVSVHRSSRRCNFAVVTVPPHPGEPDITSGRDGARVGFWPLSPPLPSPRTRFNLSCIVEPPNPSTNTPPSRKLSQLPV